MMLKELVKTEEKTSFKEVMQSISKLISDGNINKKKLEELLKQLQYLNNTPRCKIKVREKDGSWGEYTGAFKANDKQKRDAAIKNANDHFDYHFRDDKFHQNREYAFALIEKGETKIIKTVKI